MLMFYEPWFEKANCRGTDPEAFFVELNSKTSRVDRYRLETAMEICEECVVKKECLEYARNNDCVGLFGGKYVKP